MRHISNIEMSGFRCFDSTRVELGHVTLLAGPNNSGKSAFLNLVRRLASANIDRHPVRGSPGGFSVLGPTNAMQFEEADRRDGSEGTTFSITFEESVLDRIRPQRSRTAEQFEQLARVLTWPLTVNGEVGKTMHDIRLDVRLSEDETQKLLRLRHHPSHLAAAAVNLAEMLPIIVIPERRSINLPLRLRTQPHNDTIREEVFTANDILPTLLDWKCTDTRRFESVTSIAGQILGRTVTMDVRPAQRGLCVGFGAAPPRRIEDLGSGVAEALLLAMVLSKHDGGLLLYEEPELHLHPDIQRRCMSVLHQYANHDWQIIATTHSEHMLAYSQQPEFHCVEVLPSADDDQSRLEIFTGRELLRRTIMRLGAVPSVLAAKCVIWVEGPSDAIYLRHYLGVLDSELIESEHFAFAFFGGSLIKHTRLSDYKTDEIVDLFSVHPNSYVILDSDRECADGPGKSYARDFIGTAMAGRVWVTDGREIENYLPDTVLAQAAIGDSDGVIPTGIDRRFDIFSKQVNAVKAAAERGKAHWDASDGNKTEFAHKAVKFMQGHPDSLSRLDLEARVTELIEFIRQCAGIRQCSGGQRS
jgi:energy-coupling factor transporter ATP-binding protein EcfA2